MITIYILNCADGTYYTGITQDLSTRLKQHNSKKCSYTKKRLPVEVAVSFQVSDRRAAARIEKHIKSVSALGFILKHCDLLVFTTFSGHNVINGQISRTSLDYICKRFGVLDLDTTFATLR